MKKDCWLSYIRRSQIRTVLPAAEYRTDPTELSTTSVMFVSPGGQATWRDVAPPFTEVPSDVRPDDLETPKISHRVIYFATAPSTLLWKLVSLLGLGWKCQYSGFFKRFCWNAHNEWTMAAQEIYRYFNRFFQMNEWLNEWINFYSEQSIYKVNTENTAIG